MSLSASMWTSVSGLLAHGEKMNVVGNNISNVNTVGYKNQRMDFQDFVYQYTGTAAGMGQVGRGTSIGIIMSDFSQGAIETTTSSTDIAIEGNGFFKVKPQNNNMSYYTRAGNFAFNKDGYLVDPHGYVLQGWEVNLDSGQSVTRTSSGIIGTGSPVDIKLETFTCPPRHTTAISQPVNLKKSVTATADDHSMDATDPFFALLKSWDANQSPPLGSSKYAYQSTMEVYDEAGKMHKLTIYFDRVANSESQQITGNTEGESYWEYIITMDPTEDMRDFNSVYDPSGSSPTTPNVPERLKGLLGAGTLTFNSSGGLKDMTAFVPHSNPADPADQWWTGSPGAETIDLSKWIAAPISSDGFPMIAPNFTGTGGQQAAYKDGIFDRPNPDAGGRLISVDLGLKTTSNAWAFMTGPEIPASAKITLTAGPLSSTGEPLGPGGTSPVDIGGALYDTSGWTVPGIPRTIDGQAVTLYLVQDSRAGMPSQYYTTQAPAPGSGITTVQSWPVMDPAPASLEPTAVDASGAPLDKSGNPLNVGALPLYTLASLGSASVQRKDPENPSDNLTLYLVEENSTGKHFYIKNSEWGQYDADPAYTVGPAIPIAEGPVTQTLPNTAMLDNKGNPLTAKAPVAVDTRGPIYDVTQLPTTPYPPVRRLDANGKEITLYLISNPADPTRPDPYYSLEAPAAASMIVSATPLWEPDPRVVHNGSSSGMVSAADMGRSKYHINGMDGFAAVQNNSTTCLGDSFYEKNGARQDGYTYGDLRGVTVGTDGLLSASYSNGVTLQLYQIVLYDFPSNQNLRREGGNLYSETRESGAPSSGAAGTGSFGTTKGYSLEQSNADLSRELVHMITTQRGFQANSKTITTVDTMLETVINMKR